MRYLDCFKSLFNKPLDSNVENTTKEKTGAEPFAIRNPVVLKFGIKIKAKPKYIKRLIALVTPRAFVLPSEIIYCDSIIQIALKKELIKVTLDKIAASIYALPKIIGRIKFTEIKDKKHMKNVIVVITLKCNDLKIRN